MASTPTTRYTRAGDVEIAYQVIGDAPRDLVIVPGWISNIETFWEYPPAEKFFRSLASFARVILFDKRGTGLSSRASPPPGLEARMDDVRAVMDAVGSSRAHLCGYSEGGCMCCLFSATYPERTASLIMIGSYPTRAWAPDYPIGMPLDQLQKMRQSLEIEWGGPMGLDQRHPSMAHDPQTREWWSRYIRLSASPSAGVALFDMTYDIDIRHVLPAIRVPTLILHSSGDRTCSIEHSRYMAKHIPTARLVELPGGDHLPWGTDVDLILAEMEQFMTGERPAREPDRMLATVLFTDIVGSTEKAAALGDRAWRQLLERHHSAVRRELDRFRGVEIDTAGDGFLATFDGPARAIRCAHAIGQAVEPLGLKIRAGLHTGECEKISGKVGGIAVHIGARVAAKAEADEVLVSSTVKDLVAGSGISFGELGPHVLKGVPGEWNLFRVTAV